MTFKDIEREYISFLDQRYVDVLNTCPSSVIKNFLPEEEWEERVIEFGKDALDMDTEPEEDEELYM